MARVVTTTSEAPLLRLGVRFFTRRIGQGVTSAATNFRFLADDNTLKADFLFRRFGDANLARGFVPAGRLVFGPLSAEAALGAPFWLVITLGARGLALEGGEALSRGDMLLVDLAYPAVFRAERPMEILLLSFPREAVLDRLAGAPVLPPLTLSRGGGVARLFRTCLYVVWRAVAGREDPAAVVLADAKIDLLMGALRDAAMTSQDPAMRRVWDLLKLSGAIRARLAQTHIGSRELALAIGLSEAQLVDRLGGGAVQDLIRMHRLIAARRLLRSPATRRLSVLEIAQRVGFRSAARFATHYGSVFGRPPGSDRPRRPVEDFHD